MDDKNMKRISFSIEGKDYDKLKQFEHEHQGCLEKHPNMTAAQFEYSFVPDGLGVCATVTCTCGKSIVLDDGYNLFIDKKQKNDAPRFQVVPEDSKILEIVKFLLCARKRPNLYFGTQPTYSSLSVFLSGYGLGTRTINEEGYWSKMKWDVDAEFQRTIENKGYSDEEQFNIYLEVFETVLHRDYSQYVMENNL